MSDDTNRTVTVGLTGARFGRVPRYAESSQPPDPPPDDVSDLPEPEVSPPPIGARFARASRRKTRPKPPPAHQEPPLSDQEPPATPLTQEEPEPDPDVSDAPTVRVRPYVHTGGRTRTHTRLPIEALVCAAPGASPSRLIGAHRSLLELCQAPQSVAELCAQLGVPLAVAQVLVDDLMAGQMVTVQRGVDQAYPDLALLRRVLAGLRRL